MALKKLKKQCEFARLKNCNVFKQSCFVLAAKRQVNQDAGPRIGIIVTKKVGKSVVRNRIKRRLTAALQEKIEQLGDLSIDYLFICRRRLYDVSFQELERSIEFSLYSVQKRLIKQSFASTFAVKQRIKI